MKDNYDFRIELIDDKIKTTILNSNKKEVLNFTFDKIAIRKVVNGYKECLGDIR